MIGTIAKKIFGSKNERELKRLRKSVSQINALEDQMKALTDEQLKEKTSDFKQRVQEGETLSDILPEAFAVCREASRRVMGMRHFDVQLIGGMTLHEGRIAEMKTGEGKTLVATLAAYLNALSGEGVHIVTVNDYLASRDANWMRPLYEALGLEVGIITSMQPQDLKRAAYAADITYGTNNEFGFDYLRDNMVLRKEDRVQRPLNFSVVDEVDSILIDEARTPLVISGATENNAELYVLMNKLIPQLRRQEEAPEGEEIAEETGHYTIDEKTRQVEFTESGHQLIEDLLGQNGMLKSGESLYSAGNLTLLHHVHSALKAHTLFHKDVEYILDDGQVVLIDEHTGRTMVGRRLSEGLHQAIEAKEGVQIQSESQTLASTTFQNYFRLYKKLAGMTGTADTEAVEFKQIYGLDVVAIPTNKPVARIDRNDLIFLTVDDKYDAIVEEVKEIRKKNAPTLVGTASIETSEEMSRRFKKAGIAHEVLNAKQHDREAIIIAQAGRPGAVTIATNMAGRGTDIVLGGNWEVELKSLDNPSQDEVERRKKEWAERNAIVKEAGGLHIVGTERHESRRIDNQLRGRAGRQGDPGMSRFFLSLEDNLMRIFASDRVRRIMNALGMEKGEAIEHRMVNNAIETAQRKVESRNFDYRKQLLEYDDVANDQRQVIYHQRNELLVEESIEDAVSGIRLDVIDDVISEYIPPQSMAEQWDVSGLEQFLESEYTVKVPIQQWLEEDKKLYEEPLRERIRETVDKFYRDKAERIGPVIRTLEKQIMLHVLDTLWKEHLQNMDHLRQGIGLRAYAQRNPKQEYKREAFGLFESLLDNLKRDVTRVLFRVEPMTQEQADEMDRQRREAAELAQRKQQMQHEQVSALGGATASPSPAEKPATFVRGQAKVGRNEPCPCGSGKKYKACHGKLV